MRTRAPIVIGLALALATGCSPSPSGSPANSTTPASIPPASATPPTPGPSAPTGTVAPIPTAGVSVIYRTWTRSDMPIAVPGIYGGNTPNDLVAFEGRLLAVGSVNGGCCDGSFSTDIRALVWTSTDGATWELVADSPAFDLGYMYAVAARPGRVVAVGTLQLEAEATEFEGMVDPRAATWASSDGIAWRLVEGVPFFNDVVATADGFVASTLAGANPEIWGSHDGRAWTRLAGRAELGEGSIDRLLALDDGSVVAVGRSVALNLEPPSFTLVSAAVWRSPDGRAWSRVADQEAFADGWMRHVAERDGRLIAIGSGETESGTTAWVSDDGLAWRRHAATALGATDTYIKQLVAGRDGFIAVGSAGGSETTMIAWASLDGESWAMIPDQAALDGVEAAGPDLAGWVALEDGSVVAVGSRWDPTVGEPVPVSWLIR